MKDDLAQFLSRCSPSELAAFAARPGPPLPGYVMRRALRAAAIACGQEAARNAAAAGKRRVLRDTLAAQWAGCGCGSRTPERRKKAVARRLAA